MSDKKERKRIIAQQGQCKASFTRLEKYLSRTDSTTFTLEDLQVRKRNLEENFSNYKEHSISLEILEDNDSSNESQPDETEDRYLLLLATLERHIRSLQPEETPRQDNLVPMAKLPSLDIQTFDGKDVAAFKPFFELFQAVVHNDSRLTNVQRLCYLKKYLKGEPLQIIDNLPIVGASYESALQLLHCRYDNPALLVNSHVSSLLDLPSIQRSTAQQLRDVVAKVKQHIAALNNLKQPVSHWDAILSCIILRKLDPLTVRLFHSDRVTTVIPTIDELLTFLEQRAASLEASLAGEKSYSKPKSSVNVSTTVSKSNVSGKCPMCRSQNHKLYKCKLFSEQSPEKRIELVKKDKLCQICLTSHPQHKCRYKFQCSICNSSSHNALIHHEEKPGPEAKQNESKNAEQVNLHVAQPISECVLLPTAKVMVTGAKNKKFIVRALLDCGSQSSFCTNGLASRLGLPQIDLHKNVTTLGNACYNSINKGINLHIESLVTPFQMNITCSLLNKITSKLPQKQVNLSNFIIPKHVALADKEFYIPGEISLLLAADIFFKIVLDGKIEGGPADPILLNTQLGYIVSSTGSSDSNSNTTIAMHTMISPDTDMCVRQFWEAEKVPDIYHESLPVNEYSEKVFTESVSLQNNKFQVKYPLKVELQDIDPSNSYAIALQRLYSLEKRFSKDPEYYDLYKNFIHEYINLEHAKVIDINNCDPIDQPLFFLPHHGVLRPLKQTNKLRVVFDGSAKNKNDLCLNDYMCNGPVVQKPLFDTLLLFRMYQYTIQCDIRHMYRMIQVHPEHRCLQNILWRENDIMSVLQLQTVTYGLTSSAFVATRCLIELARRYKNEYPLASDAVLNNSYIDDIQAGHETLEGVLQLKKELMSLMSHASLHLHKWVSNNAEVLMDIPQDKLGVSCRNLDRDQSVIKILGIVYDASDDVFRLSGRVITPTKIPTKRSVLSSISRLYDPLGLVGPLNMRAKLFLQELWQHNLDWDSPLPADLEKFWDQFYTNLVSMPEIIIPRYVQTVGANEVQLIGYCDASSTGYGCCVYIKVVKGDMYYIHLLCSKSRLNGINSRLTIPKLELNGSLLLAKLVSHVSSVLNIKDVHLFCDSKIVLSWVQMSPLKVPAYIGNRVREINRLTGNSLWHFTPGLLNPADILSRGADPMEIYNNSLWKHGPDYLRNSPSNYNFYLAEIEKPLYHKNNTNQASCFTVLEKDNIHPLFEKYSSLYKTICVMSNVQRFINKCKRHRTTSGQISVQEYREALTFIIKGIQRYYFAEELRCIVQEKEVKTSLKSLHPFIDDAGICRVGGRLHNADVKYTKRYPIILPKHCHITTLIIRQEHLASLHGGIKLLISNLSQKYYIINSVREVKNVIHKCVVCCRYKAEASKQIMGSLPKDRVSPSRVFERIGMDYCGPFDIKQSSKRNSIISKGYVALFVCFASKAVHIEVVSDMSTDTFLAAFKRFISRRGIPTDIYCDNATTFKGANNQLVDLFKLHNSKDFQDAVHNCALQKEIKFHFIPTYSPNHGGLWEAAVKSAKFHLKRISGSKIFTYEQFTTVMTEIESILNSRPLFTITTQDSNDFSCLTPGHFIIGSSLTAIPQPDLTDVQSNRLRFWRSCEQVRQHFWKVWSKDYLSTLNQRTKWRKIFPNIKVGTVVLLINPNTPPLNWPMGRVSKAILGNDNHVRVVEVQTSNGKLHRRAVSKIVVLPTE